VCDCLCFAVVLRTHPSSFVLDLEVNFRIIVTQKSVHARAYVSISHSEERCIWFAIRFESNQVAVRFVLDMERKTMMCSPVERDMKRSGLVLVVCFVFIAGERVCLPTVGGHLRGGRRQRSDSRAIGSSEHMETCK
jgi:hypothetical protein